MASPWRRCRCDADGCFADTAAKDEQSGKRAVGAVGSFRNAGAWIDKAFREGGPAQN